MEEMLKKIGSWLFLIGILVAVIVGSTGILVIPNLLTNMESTSNENILEITSASIDPSLFWFQANLTNNENQADLPQYAIELEKLILFNETKNCSNCKLSKTRTKYVFGSGSSEAKIMFIGEGPGREEELQGIPFVGRAVKLLTAIIEKGMKLKREDVYIRNIVKCRPTVNLEMTKDRPPDPEEVEACNWIL